MNQLLAILSEADFLKSVPCEKLSFSAGNIIVKEEDEGQELYLITKGEVEVSSSIDDVNGLQTKLARLGESDIFGELSVFDCEPRSAQITALSDCELYKIHGPKLIAYLDDHPAEGYFIMRDLFMHLICRLRQNNLRTKMAMQMYYQEHDDD